MNFSPYQKPHLPPSSSTSPISDSNSPPLPRRRILILEDDPFFSRFLFSYLSKQGFKVEHFPDGETGLYAAIQCAYDHIICDIDLSGLSGIDIYTSLSAANPSQCKRFIFISGSPDSAFISSFIERIGGTILYKPFRIEELTVYLSK